MPLQAGISGTKAEGADSIVVNGGYEDDEDHGDEIVYTGAGANDPSTRRQVADQDIDQSGIAGLITSELEGLPVRVVRGYRGDPAHSPATGYRYDGLFRVDGHWGDVGKSGFRVWRFKLVRLADEEAGPYIPEINLPTGNQTPRSTAGIVTRVVRSTQVSDAVKRMYDSTCQVCGVRLVVPNRPIAEGAHIRALGRPHNGPDVPDNVICLCPNHHTLFDYGGIWIDDNSDVRAFDGAVITPLTTHGKHSIDPAHLRYHRELWGH
jgi:putative restriction endonuclease